MEVLDSNNIGIVSVIDCHLTPNLGPVADHHVGKHVELEEMVPTRLFLTFNLLPPAMREHQYGSGPYNDHLNDNRLGGNLLVVLKLNEVHHKVVQVT